MKLICENSNFSHINANGVHGDAAGTIGQLDTLLHLCTLGAGYGAVITDKDNVPKYYDTYLVV